VQLYRRHIFPRVMDWALSRAPFSVYRRAALADVGGDVLEIGFGTGLNLAFYPPAVASLTIVDANPGVHALAVRRLEAFPHPVTRHLASIEALPLPDAVFDVVVSTWTLCSIADVDRALCEVRRVLRPGGRFVFVEHGRSEDAAVRRWQDRLTPVQRRLADGCHLNRDIEAIVSRRLPIASMTRSYAGGAPRIIGCMYEGTAIKAP
jgi:ubiquinone/menaquinone biosynthesis C-methylase UbiE